MSLDSIVSAVALAILAGLAGAAIRERRRRVPVILDPMHHSNGGAAGCLAMVLARHGMDVSLDALRSAIAVPDGGTNALVMLNVARAHGLEGRGLKLEYRDDLTLLPTPCLLHRRNDTFVVLEAVREDNLVIVDPVRGRVQRTHREVWGESSGIVLTFQRG